MNLPNWITVGRVVLIPVFLILSYGSSTASAVGAFVVFLVASISDFVDGYLARRSGIVSKMGEFLDPLADKLLVGAALFVLVDTRGFPLWAALLIALREVAIQILRTQVVSGGGRLPASSLGKLKTVSQIVMICWWLLPWDHINVGHWMWLGGALVSTYWSGALYFVKSNRIKELTE
jgi:CDP-diacylglycerol---glycerol-3-phosphate 3-phosphatidyltransferase